MLMRVEFTAQKHRLRVLQEPRRLSEWEQAVSHLILDDSDAAAIGRKHLATAKVEEECSHCPSVWFQVDSTLPPILDPRFGAISTAFPRTLNASDSDGMGIAINLFVMNGYVEGLDVYRYDGENVIRPPKIQEMRVTREPSGLP
jgi:hypothetical protein